MATVHALAKRYDKAERLQIRALEVHKAYFGKDDHPYIGIGLNDLALIYKDTGRHAAAEPLFQRSIAILEGIMPPDHPELMRTRENYARLLDELGRPAEAAQIRSRRGGSPPEQPTSP